MVTFHSAGNLFGLDPVLYLRSVSVLTIAFGGLTSHRWLCMLSNIRCTVLSNPTLSATLHLSLQSPDRGHKSTPDDLRITRGYSQESFPGNPSVLLPPWPVSRLC